MGALMKTASSAMGTGLFTEPCKGMRSVAWQERRARARLQTPQSRMQVQPLRARSAAQHQHTSRMCRQSCDTGTPSLGRQNEKRAYFPSFTSTDFD